MGLTGWNRADGGASTHRHYQPDVQYLLLKGKT